MPQPSHRLSQRSLIALVAPLTLSCLLLTGCGHHDNPDRDATTDTTPAQPARTTDASTSTPVTDSRWDINTGAHAPDQTDTSSWPVLNIALDSLSVSSVSSQLVVQPPVDNISTVTLDGKPVITVTRTAQGVTIRATTGNAHLAYQLTGTGTTPLTIQSDSDYRLLLSDAHLNSPDGPALHLQSTQTAFLDIKGNNTLSDTDLWNPRTGTDGTASSPSATLTASGPVVVRGDGSLGITSAAHHSLSIGGHLRMASGTLSLTAAAKDGLHADHAFIMDGGALTINTPAGKGIKVEGKENTSQALGFVAINDGQLSIKSHDKAISASWKVKNAKTPETTDDPDPRVTINGGTLDITTTGTPVEHPDNTHELSPEGIEAKSVIAVHGGNLTLNTTDDCFNAGTRFDMTNGRVYAYSSLQDAVDSNGTMSISGGTLVAVSHAPRPEGALDSDSHEFAIRGGTLIGIGAYNSTPTASASTQNVIAIPTNVDAGQWTVQDAAGNAAFSYRLPFRAGYLIASSPTLTKGSTYTIVRGGTLGPVGEDFHSLAIQPTTLTGGTPGDTFSIADTLTKLGATEFDWYSPELGPGD